jgi:threonine dehydratase
MSLYQEVLDAQQVLKGVVNATPLQYNYNLSHEYNAHIYLKREDLQVVRSYKIRGAYNKISHLDAEQKQLGIVCASAGNHAQGFALSCRLLQIYGKVYMPKTTPNQKIKQVKLFGKDFIEILLIGDTFDDAYAAAMSDAQENQKAFIHPFNDDLIIAGQGTVGLEILNDINEPIDYVIVPVGGGGLTAGLVTVFEKSSPKTKIIGVEPDGAPSMVEALKYNEPVVLQSIDRFVDGAAVKRVGDKTFDVIKGHLHKMQLVPEGKICTTILKLYNEEAIVVEPAGAMSIAALDFLKEDIAGKTVVCLVTGGNNDIERTEEIKERSLIYEGLKHYFMVNFPQRPGALKEFVSDILSENDDITYFQFAKKNNRENAPAIVGLELKNPTDLDSIKTKMHNKGYGFDYLNENEVLFAHFIG